MKRIFGLAAFSVMLAGSAMAENITTFSLDNGMEVVVLEDHRAPVVVQMVWYRAGAADEPLGRSGIAHFLEHLLFKGTDTMAPGEFSKTVSANGGSDNAFTSWDYTAYYQRVAADRLELMMKMESDRMRNLRLSEADVLTERQVIIEERNQRTENDPGALFGEQRRAAQYLNNPYGTPVIGWRHEMVDLSLDDAMGYYRKFYAPNNAILIVAGDVDPENVHQLAKTYYGPLAPTEGLTTRLRAQEPPQLSARRLTYADPRVSQPYVIRTYLAPERDAGAQEKAAALVMLAELLGGNSATSVLGQKLQFEKQTALYTSASYDATAYDDTTFSLVIVPSEGVTLQAAEAAMDDVVAEFIKNGIDAEQFARIKMQLRSSYIYEQDDIQGVAQRYGEALTSGLTIADVQAWPDILQAVTEADVIAAAKDVFDLKKSVTGWLMRSDVAPDTVEITQ
jgi:zinc protease